MRFVFQKNIYVRSRSRFEATDWFLNTEQPSEEEKAERIRVAKKRVRIAFRRVQIAFRRVLVSAHKVLMAFYELLQSSEY